MRKTTLHILGTAILLVASVFLVGCQAVPNGTSVNGVLDLSGQGLTQVPSYVFGMTDLVELDLSNNKLTGAIPGEIRFLSDLRVLDLSDNQMTGVAAEVGQLSKLEILDLSNNDLTGLPNELGNLQNLQRLDLAGNDYSESDLSTILQRLPVDVEVVR